MNLLTTRQWIAISVILIFLIILSFLIFPHRIPNSDIYDIPDGIDLNETEYFNTIIPLHKKNIEIKKDIPSIDDSLFYISIPDENEIEINDDEIIALSKCVWGEARGVSQEEQSLVLWCVFQRVDDDRWPDTIIEVLTQYRQFIGYKEHYPIDEEIYKLSIKEFTKWKNGEIPPTNKYCDSDKYYFFSGDGKHNWFREKF